MSLQKMGYRFDGNSLTQFDADVFYLISSEFDKLGDEERQKQRKKR